VSVAVFFAYHPHRRDTMAKIQFLPLALRALLALGALSQAVAAGEGETVVVITTKHRFEPAEVTVKVGTTVRWENREKVQFHNVTFPTRVTTLVTTSSPAKPGSEPSISPGPTPILANRTTPRIRCAV
jgi:plastocyanin